MPQPSTRWDLQEEELRESALVVFANKQDLPGALTAAVCAFMLCVCMCSCMHAHLRVQEISEKLGLATIKNRQWAIFQTSAVKGEGLYEGLDWLTNTLTSTS